MNYNRISIKRLSTPRLLKAFEQAKREWHDLPRRSSFSGLHVSGQLNLIQQTLESRKVEFEPFITEVNMLG